jgi:rhodanese-related sulfurtransferase
MSLVHIILFCRSGARAVRAKSTLEELGYENVSMGSLILHFSVSKPLLTH